MDSKQRKNTEEENDARDVEIYKALTAHNPRRPIEQNQPDIETKGLETFCFVQGKPEQKWLRDGEPVIQDNSFWRSLAKSHGGSQSLWPIYKHQTSHYLSTILDIRNTNLLQTRSHPRAILYTVLNGHAGGRTSAHLKKKPADLLAQTDCSSDAPVSSELFQVVADLYSIELLVFFLKDGAGEAREHGVVSRGQHNSRQVFLSCYIPSDTTSTNDAQNENHPKTSKAFYQPVIPVVSKPWDFKFDAHMQGDKARVNAKRCPFVFSAGKVGALVMPGIPEAMAKSLAPPPPIFPFPVPVVVGQGELKGVFEGYRGPVGDGAEMVLGPKMYMAFGRTGSVRGGRAGTPSWEESSVARGRTSTASSVGGPSTPTATAVAGRTRSRSSIRDSTESSRRRTSDTRPRKPSITSQSRTSSINGSPAPTPTARANRARSRSSVRDNTDSSRRRSSVSNAKKTSVTGKSQTPSVTSSSGPIKKKVPAALTPGKKSSASGGTSVTIQTHSRPAEVSKTSKPPAVSAPKTKNATPSATSTKPSSIVSNNAPRTTSIPTTPTHHLPNHIKPPSITKLPAPPSSTRRK